jgi:hypothetical protein
VGFVDAFLFAAEDVREQHPVEDPVHFAAHSPQAQAFPVVPEHKSAACQFLDCRTVYALETVQIERDAPAVLTRQPIQHVNKTTDVRFVRFPDYCKGWLVPGQVHVNSQRGLFAYSGH